VLAYVIMVLACVVRCETGNKARFPSIKCGFVWHFRAVSPRLFISVITVGPVEAREAFDKFVELVKGSYVPERVKTGEFGAMMQVSLVSVLV
jgi:D-Tyr-tRNA(Tyr) deacylase